MMGYKIAAMAGDGIGKEVLPEGLKVLNKVIEKYQLPVTIDCFDWPSCDYYQQHGRMMPDNWFDILKGYDAIYFGAIGWPESVPDHISLWGSMSVSE